jgi:TM2 domain-containing membrane protein YozV
MKIGVRTPSLKKSFKARTTGRINRTLKKSVNPLYGKKGIGYIKNPEKAIYNKVYHKVTVDPLGPLKNGHNNKTKRALPKSELEGYNFYKIEAKEYTCNKKIYIILAVFFGVFGVQYFYSGQKKKGFLSLCFFWTVIPFFVGLYCALTALFLKADSNGNIKIVDKKKVKTDQLSKASEALKEIEKYSIPLTTTSDLEIYSDSLKNTLENLSELVILCENFPQNESIVVLAESVEGMYKGLEGEESNFIKRYYSEQLEISKRSDNPEYLKDSKHKLIDSGIFSDQGIELIELLYK